MPFPANIQAVPIIAGNRPQRMMGCPEKGGGPGIDRTDLTVSGENPDPAVCRHVLLHRFHCHVRHSPCRTIRSIDPNLKVLYGGTAHVPMDYLERTFQAGAGDWFDILCIHPYGQSLLPEEFIPYQMLRLRELMKKYHLEHKEIWATEIGWPTGTVPKPWIYQAILPRAFSSCGIDPAKAVIGVIRDLDNGFCVSSPCFSLLDSFPAFHRVREVSFSELATLSVSECPVLVPCAEEIFPTSYHGDLVEYVKRGGTILLPEGIPFGYDHPTLSEGCAPAPKSIQRALHISVNGYWSMGIQETTEIEIPGFTPPDQRMKKQARFLSDRNLSGSDRFIPLAFGVDANGKRYPFAGVYRLNSDLKGNVIVMASRSACTRHEISRTWQGMILPRAYLTLLAEGVSRVYWYKLTSSGEDDCGNQERNFGIMAVERKPKPAFLACRVLTEECPVGSTIPRITRNGDVFFASWTRPDGKKKCAVWSLEKAVQTSLSSTPIAARSHLGEELAVTGRTILASPAIVYYTCL